MSCLITTFPNFLLRSKFDIERPSRKTKSFPAKIWPLLILIVLSKDVKNQNKILRTIMVIISWDSVIFYQIFSSSQEERSVHCVKSVQIRSFFWSVFSCIWTNTGKYGPQKTPYLGNKDDVHELFQELPDDLTLRKLGSKEIRKYQKNVENSWN